MNYSIKSDLKEATSIEISDFTKKIDLDSIKSDIDKLDFEELEKVSRGFNSLKSKRDKLDGDTLKPVTIDLKN